MEHFSLYRKYRPTRFEDVIGQEHITRALKNQIISDKISHAYLFTGSRGIGKTSIARIFAKAVNCENNVNGSPCGNCPTCKRLESENDINIIEIDAASNNRVDDVRDLREKVKFMPAGAKYKVYIIDEVHMLTDSAFNALLKTLEEPPQHIIFILATTEVHKLPQTILSRCTRFDFRLVSTETLTKHLEDIFDKEGIKYESDALRAIAIAGEGSVRDTLSIADCVLAYCDGVVTSESVRKVLGTTDTKLLLDFTQSLKEKDVGKVLTLINDIDKSGKNLSVFVKDMAKHVRNLLICSSCADASSILAETEEDFKKLKEQSESFEMSELINMLQVFGGAENELRYTLSPRILLETLALSIISGDGQVKKKLNLSVDYTKLSPRVVWGKVVLYLKERKFIALHVACGDITNVSIDSNKFIITVDDGMLINLLKEGKREIENALKWQGLDMEVILLVKENVLSKSESDINKLKSLISDEIKIKGEK